VRQIATFILLGTILIFPLVFAEDLTSSNFILRNPTINFGGGWATSTNFETFSALGQTGIGESTSTNFTGQSGFAYIQDPEFSLSASSSISFGSLPVSTSAQTSTSSMSGVKVIDTRGIGAGWSLTITATNLTLVGASSTLAGSNDTISFSGTYTGVAATSTYGTYEVEITTGGSVGTAVFKWTDPAGTITTDVTTTSTIALNNGISVNFNAATYVVGDKWILRVDSISYQDLTLTPGSITVNFGDTDVTAGSSGTFSGSGATANARTLMSATAGNGEGSYTQNEDFSQSVHANTLNGSFSGTITLTSS